MVFRQSKNKIKPVGQAEKCQFGDSGAFGWCLREFDYVEKKKGVSNHATAENLHWFIGIMCHIHNTKTAFASNKN